MRPNVLLHPKTTKLGTREHQTHHCARTSHGLGTRMMTVFDSITLPNLICSKKSSQKLSGPPWYQIFKYFQICWQDLRQCEYYFILSVIFYSVYGMWQDFRQLLRNMVMMMHNHNIEHRNIKNTWKTRKNNNGIAGTMDFINSSE